MFKDIEYLGAYLDNTSKEKVHQYANAILGYMDEYVESFEVLNDFEIKTFDRELYHVTVMDSEEPFTVFVYDDENIDDITTVEADFDGQLLYLELFSDKLEQLHEQCINSGAMPKTNDYVAYVTFAKVYGDYSESLIMDMLDYAISKTFIDVELGLGMFYSHKDSTQDYDKNEDNFTEFSS